MQNSMLEGFNKANSQFIFKKNTRRGDTVLSTVVTICCCPQSTLLVRGGLSRKLIIPKMLASSCFTLSDCTCWIVHTSSRALLFVLAMCFFLPVAVGWSDTRRSCTIGILLRWQCLNAAQVLLKLILIARRWILCHSSRFLMELPSQSLICSSTNAADADSTFYKVEHCVSY